VAGLWKVPDRATQALMERFYDNLWRKKMSKLAALRESQVWMLREGPKQSGLRRGLDLGDDAPQTEARRGLPPYYWAAFVLSGDWE
jgi:CHAT domain-containing protein